MAEQKKNAQVLNGVNDDITELKSLTTLRKRVVSVLKDARSININGVVALLVEALKEERFEKLNVKRNVKPALNWKAGWRHWRTRAGIKP